MALKSTIYKAELQISDMDRHYYQTHNFTLALHPSETEERMMVRLLAFILNASDNLEFCKGLSTDEEPDLWKKSLNGDIELWIELGQLDEKRIKKACSLSQKVIVYTYSENSANVWWGNNQNKLQRYKNLSVIKLNNVSSVPYQQIANRNMQLHCTIQDQLLWLSNNTDAIDVEQTLWK